MRLIDADALREFIDCGHLRNPLEMCFSERDVIDMIESRPSAQPEVILCNSCKHWTQSTGKMTGYGLGRCDFHDADLVTCNGFCYWAERRTDGKTT